MMKKTLVLLLICLISCKDSRKRLPLESSQHIKPISFEHLEQKYPEKKLQVFFNKGFSLGKEKTYYKCYSEYYDDEYGAYDVKLIHKNRLEYRSDVTQSVKNIDTIVENYYVTLYYVPPKHLKRVFNEKDYKECLSSRNTLPGINQDCDKEDFYEYNFKTPFYIYIYIYDYRIKKWEYLHKDISTGMAGEQIGLNYEYYIMPEKIQQLLRK